MRFGEPGRLLRAAADGWSMAWIFYESSGRGYSYQIFGGRRLPGGHESINGSGGIGGSAHRRAQYPAPARLS